MMNQTEIPEKNIDKARQENSAERREPVEKTENRHEDKVLGAEILEEPKDGSFIHALQVFVAWVNSLLAGKKDE